MLPVLCTGGNKAASPVFWIVCLLLGCPAVSSITEYPCMILEDASVCAVCIREFNRPTPPYIPPVSLASVCTPVLKLLLASSEDLPLSPVQPFHLKPHYLHQPCSTGHQAFTSPWQPTSVQRMWSTRRGGALQNANFWKLVEFKSDCSFPPALHGNIYPRCYRQREDNGCTLVNTDANVLGCSRSRMSVWSRLLPHRLSAGLLPDWLRVHQR